MMSKCANCGAPTDWTIGDAIMECGSDEQLAHPMYTKYQPLIGCCDKTVCITNIIRDNEFAYPK